MYSSEYTHSLLCTPHSLQEGEQLPDKGEGDEGTPVGVGDSETARDGGKTPPQGTGDGAWAERSLRHENEAPRTAGETGER